MPGVGGAMPGVGGAMPGGGGAVSSGAMPEMSGSPGGAMPMTLAIRQGVIPVAPAPSCNASWERQARAIERLTHLVTDIAGFRGSPALPPNTTFPEVLALLRARVEAHGLSWMMESITQFSSMAYSDAQVIPWEPQETVWHPPHHHGGQCPQPLQLGGLEKV